MENRKKHLNLHYTLYVIMESAMFDLFSLSSHGGTILFGLLVQWQTLSFRPRVSAVRTVIVA